MYAMPNRSTFGERRVFFISVRSTSLISCNAFFSSSASSGVNSSMPSISDSSSCPSPEKLFCIRSVSRRTKIRSTIRTAASINANSANAWKRTSLSITNFKTMQTMATATQAAMPKPIRMLRVRKERMIFPCSSADIRVSAFVFPLPPWFFFLSIAVILPFAVRRFL